ncbi:hypothetical protein RESH_03501 [Rhodopirellula europaea SH398]|uniref:Uncharacterized protein n=1 Tax=Rhodopirellula europaea SH398 TaxID=1263868 RepID=M5S2X7_9BACT|nr:hypothetical protein RESH_03501 [Rhodopirellula europaea SH398]
MVSQARFLESGESACSDTAEEISNSVQSNERIMIELGWWE